MITKIPVAATILITLMMFPGTGSAQTRSVLFDCTRMDTGGLLPLATERDLRFQGKVSTSTADCRGGAAAVAGRATPWVDWENYWATGDATSKSSKLSANLALVGADQRGITGALLDLEYQRMELIRFNLFDNSTFEEYLNGAVVNGKTVDGSTLTTWKEMRLPATDPQFGKL